MYNLIIFKQIKKFYEGKIKEPINNQKIDYYINNELNENDNIQEIINVLI